MTQYFEDLTQQPPHWDTKGRAVCELVKINHGLVVMQKLFEVMATVPSFEAPSLIIVRYQPGVWN